MGKDANGANENVSATGRVEFFHDRIRNWLIL